MKHFPMARLSMRMNLTLLMMVVIALISGISWVITWLLRYFHINWIIPDIVWNLVIAIVLGSVAASFIGIWIFAPITRLGKAMEQVSGGHFDTRLDTNQAFPEIRKLYTHFNRMSRELEATEILQTDFISNVSHEFKTPISAIEGYATLLQAEDGDRELYLEKILLNTRRLSRLVGDILLLSKVDNQAIPGKETTFRLDEQIRQSIVLLEPEWSRREVELDVRLQRLEYTANEALLSHVWDNLIGNAIKFSPQGAFVGVTLEQQPDRLVFQVEDRGPGIPQEAMSHIFDRFYQTDSSHKEEGSGLGLALVKQIVSACGGTVEAENLPQGCRFTVTLP